MESIPIAESGNHCMSSQTDRSAQKDILSWASLWPDWTHPMSTPTQETGQTFVNATMASALFILGKLGIHTWSDAANVAVTCYTLLLITDWFWKKFWRAFFERRGWIKPKAKPQVPAEDEAEK